MLRFPSDNRKIAVLDLDGCLCQNPEAARYRTVNDPDFWHKHWADPLACEPNKELIEMAHALISANWSVIVLTARPDTYRTPTVRFVSRFGLFTTFGPREMCDQPVSLVMRPAADGISRSGPWKRDLIKSWIEAGANIQFALEDYKPNADAIREVVPVLLYEQMKSPGHIAGWESQHGKRETFELPSNTPAGTAIVEVLIPCCEWDDDKDGNCPRHPTGRTLLRDDTP